MTWGKDDYTAEEEEEEEDPYDKSVNDHIVFLIDARQDMFIESSVTGEVSFINSLKVALIVMKSKIIASEKDSVGIVFFGAVSILLQLHSSFPLVCVFMLYGAGLLLL